MPRLVRNLNAKSLIAGGIILALYLVLRPYGCGLQRSKGDRAYGRLRDFIYQRLESNARYHIPLPSQNTNCGWREVSTNKFELWGLIDMGSTQIVWQGRIEKWQNWKVTYLKVGDDIVRDFAQ